MRTGNLETIGSKIVRVAPGAFLTGKGSHLILQVGKTLQCASLEQALENTSEVMRVSKQRSFELVLGGRTKSGSFAAYIMLGEDRQQHPLFNQSSPYRWLLLEAICGCSAWYQAGYEQKQLQHAEMISGLTNTQVVGGFKWIRGAIFEPAFQYPTAPTEAHIVAGFIEHVEINRRGEFRKILYRWDDKLGEPVSFATLGREEQEH